MNKDILYVATSLFCSTDARVLTNEKQVNNLLDNSTNWQVFKVDKKTFKDLQKMAKKVIFNNQMIGLLDDYK